MIISRNNKFSRGGGNYRSLLIAAAILCGAFAATAANLPAGYTKVEYIQGDGSTGYLVTDFSPDPSDDTIVAEAELTTYGNVNPQCLFESAAMNLATTEPKQGIVLRSEGLRFDFVGNGTPCYKDEVKATVGKRIIYTVKGGRMTWTGGMHIENSDPAPAAWSGPLQILGIRYKGAATFCSSIKLYSLKVFRGNQLIHDYVPVVDGQSNPTLYDVCGNSVVERNGTFTAGPALWLKVEEIPVQLYQSGLACEPRPKAVDIASGATLREGKDYTLSWADNDSVGKGSVTFTGIGSFDGKSQTAFFSIAPRLPDGYKAVEYAHSSGEQFVDTGFCPNEKTRADIRFLMHSSGDYSSPFGARNDNADQFFVSGKHSADYYFSRHGTGATDTAGKDGYIGSGALVGKPSVIGYHKFSLNRNVFSLDQYSYSFSASATFTCPYSAYVFASHGTGGIQHPAAMELYSLKIWDDGVLVRDLIPCIKDEGGVETVGLYDVLPNASKRFYENEGSGALTAGPDAEQPSPVTILPIPVQKCTPDVTPEPGFTITNTATGANWTFAQGGVAPAGCPFDAAYSRVGDVGVVTVTGKAGGDYVGVTIWSSYSASSEMLVNGDFEAGVKSPWTGGSIGDSNSPYSPNQHTTFISGTYCGIIQRPNSMTQVFTNDAPCFAKLSWKCKRRTNNNCPVYYTVTIDGNVVWPEEKFTGNEIWFRKVDNIKLGAGEHTLVFQVRTDNNEDSTLFIDDVSLRNMGTTVKELLVNGDFEFGRNSPWTGGHIEIASGGYGPNYETTFISGNYCAVIQMSENKTQVFTNNAPYIATLSWKYKHRTNFYATNPMYYTVTIDGNLVWGEEKVTGSTVLYQTVEGIKLAPGVHTLVFQGRTDNDQDSSLFLDDISLWVTRKISGFSIIVR